MPYILKVWYPGLEDREREARMIADAAAAGGRLDFREPLGVGISGVRVTFIFEGLAEAELAAATLREHGERVERIVSTGP